MPVSVSKIAGTHHNPLVQPSVAANETGSRIVLVAPFDCKLSGIVVYPTAAMTHNDSNYAVMDVQVDSESVLDEPFSFDDAYGDLSAGEELLLDCGDVELEAGDVVFLEITQESAGLAVPVFVTDALILAN